VSSAFVKLIEVTKRFDESTAVDCVSLEVPGAHVLGLLGPSGCGKTTLLRLIAGLETPDEGEIWVGGQRVAMKKRNIVPPHARNVGFVFQDLALWPHLTVADNLDFVLRSCGWERHARRKRIDEVLRLVHIASHVHRYPSQLSGGEQQRAAIARALVAHSQLLLLDEPLSNLDTDLKANLLRELSALQQELKVTTVYVTHDRDEVAGFAHRVALMKSGQIDQNLSTELLREQSKGKTGELAEAIS
jgi:ABC-type Fe3+/spermidine/putrescine transport system ATPase subunit